MQKDELKVNPGKVVDFLRGEVLDENGTMRTSRYMKVYRYQMAVTTARALGMLDELPVNVIVKETIECFDGRSGLFGGYPGGDGHVLYTLNALQVLVQTAGLGGFAGERLQKMAESIRALGNDDGVWGDQKTRELDTRFAFSAAASLQILSKYTGDEQLNYTQAERERLIDAMLKHFNQDGGCGAAPFQESHAANLYCCLGTLKILGAIERLSKAQLNKTKFYLLQRQTASGGFNGRPEKLPDACYAQWCGLPLVWLGVNYNIPTHIDFLLSCYDHETGGFADRPGNEPDTFHTHFVSSAIFAYLLKDQFQLDNLLEIASNCFSQ